MSYSKMATKKEAEEKLTKVNPKEKITKSGIPLIYENNNLFIDTTQTHNLIIGSMDSGKTQALILPTLKLALKAKESFFIIDPNGDIYKQTAHTIKKEDYDLIILDFDGAKYGNNWNPFTLIYNLYKEENKDKAIKLIEALGYYLFNEPKNNISDPFWINTTIDYFTGLTLYLLENSDKEITIKDICDLSVTLNNDEKIKEFMQKIDKKSIIYYNLSGTLNAPYDTRGSILSVFNQKIKPYITRENLTDMLSKTDFDITNVSNKPTAIFVVSGNENSNLIPLFIHELIESINLYGKKEKTINLLLEEFDSLIPLKDFNKTIMNSRNLKVKFTVAINNFTNLNNIYGKENADILKFCFGNIIYLYSNDIDTLEEISRLCGTKEDRKPLITKEELKTLKQFESVLLMPRMMPYKTKLLPDYKIDWNYVAKETELPIRQK